MAATHPTSCPVTRGATGTSGPTTLARLAELEPRIRGLLRGRRSGYRLRGAHRQQLPGVLRGLPMTVTWCTSMPLLPPSSAARCPLLSPITICARRAPPTWRTSRSPSPSIQPMIFIESGGVGNHHPDFAAACATPLCRSCRARRRGGDGGHRDPGCDAGQPLRERLLAKALLASPRQPALATAERARGHHDLLGCGRDALRAQRISARTGSPQGWAVDLAVGATARGPPLAVGQVGVAPTA